jgi:uncharacterized membrane protein YkoI
VLKSVCLIVGLALTVGTFAPVEARERMRFHNVDPTAEIGAFLADQIDPAIEDQQPGYDVALDQSQVAVAPSEAAAIAQDMVPGAKVVGVRLLPNGYYAVTLRSKGSVTRIQVSATDGSVR